MSSQVMRMCTSTLRVLPRAGGLVAPRAAFAQPHLVHQRPAGSGFARFISFKSFMGSNDKQEESKADDNKSETTQAQEQQQQAQGQEGASAQDAASEADPHVTELEQQLKTAQEEAKDLKEKYLRALAEMENVRERARHQVEDAKHYGIQKFAKDMLEIADVLQLALDNVPQDAKEHGDAQALRDLNDGLQTTNKLLHNIFERHQLHLLNPVGEKFDPNHHDALFEVPPSDDATSGTVAVVTKAGYSLNGRTIRPAQVGVVAKK
ncbi:hypothetical protein PTSG_05721 [Salpingoeca rosetta]|uniref:GrpE protein homolog n=1 Tax=Salpingoeca rosetta (strain ATCC 50818 / BSB-021) TaxID=946362 RepID=F2UB11_SALR5|nr:uncharacterized protein PTSG_05721 [Salpingoeca rosetta]EGD74024.1 hypothetical protein PTSG_05721 [Salpingoeca rosetta]|eukprot:XP_004993586.1 hypothetical protein PTSG_05721 [Salpingoeca rosetta]